MSYTEIAGYKFNNPKLLETALTHTSYSNEKKVESNQRLEFLGDGVVGLVIGEYIYKTFPSMDEGDLSKIRAGIVCEKGLKFCAEQINLGDYLRLGKGEEMSGGRQRASNLEDAFEAVIGAVFLDSDFVTAKNFALKIMEDLIIKMIKQEGIEDSKTALQEVLQKNGNCSIVYKLVSQEGPDHARVYTMEVLVNGRREGTGTGHSKKEAEQNAAKNALKALRK